MIEYTDSLNLNAHTAEDPNRTFANALEIIPITSVLNRAPDDRLKHSSTNCPKCKSPTISGIKNAGDLLDLNDKRDFCSDVQRILHEEKCVIKLQTIILNYNQDELSNFQLELNIV
jgi:hypothetical protein